MGVRLGGCRDVVDELDRRAVLDWLAGDYGRRPPPRRPRPPLRQRLAAWLARVSR